MRRFLLLLPLISLALTCPTQGAQPVNLSGELVVDIDARTLTVPGRFVIVQGELEFLVVAEHGKMHETLLTIGCTGQDLKLGLLLIGLEESPEEDWFGGDRVVIDVEWEQDGELHRARAEELVVAAHRQAHMQRTGWVFTGSQFLNREIETEDGIEEREVFAGDSYGNYVAIYHDPLAILDSPLKWAGDDQVWFANVDRVPPRDTPARLTFRVPGPDDLALPDREASDPTPLPDPLEEPVRRVERDLVEVAARFSRTEGRVTIALGGAEKVGRVSLLAADGEVSRIGQALDAAGLQASGDLDWFGGSRLVIEVEWTDGEGNQQVVPLEELVVEPGAGPLEAPGWTYTGSRRVRARRYLGDDQWEQVDVPACDLWGPAISLIGDCNALVDVRRKPPDRWWVVNQERVPPPGTEAIVRFRRAE